MSRTPRPPGGAGGTIANEFDPCQVECLDHLGQAIHNAANVAGTGFHSLNCGHGQARQLGQGLLVDTEKRAPARNWAAVIMVACLYTGCLVCM